MMYLSEEQRKAFGDVLCSALDEEVFHGRKQNGTVDVMASRLWPALFYNLQLLPVLTLNPGKSSCFFLLEGS